MFKVGDKVIYGANGVCTVSDITQRRVLKKNVDYFVLKPLSEEHSTLFIPIDCDELTVKIKPLLSKTEAEQIIIDLKNHDDIWIQDENQRKAEFSSILNSGDRLNILIVIRSIYNHKELLASEGKRLHLHDKKLFRNAQRIICDEFSIALGMDADEVPVYIAKKQHA